jgi:glucokinase
MPIVLGLDFGGTKLAAGLVDTTSGAVLRRAVCPTPAAGGAESSLAAMVDIACDLLDTSLQPLASSLSAIGVSFGGPVAPDGRTVRFSMHIPGWEGLPLAERLEAMFGAPATLANDGDAAALAESRFGAGRGVQHMLYLTVSTGIGGGVIIGGQLHRGTRARGGEVGHQILKPDGPPCPCGRNGCLESLASGLAVAREARARLAAPGRQPSVLDQIALDVVTARDIAAAVVAGDALAQAVWAEAMEWLGIGVASACNLLDPGRVVIGGGLTRAGALLFEPVRRVADYRLMQPEIEIVPAALGDDVGILGGAALVIAGE